MIKKSKPTGIIWENNIPSVLVLCRHVDCSTQFFVLLQSAPWMAHKYVAFGQLIDGDSTLKMMDSVETFYESPTVPVIIEKAGVLNLECQGIRVSKSTNEYIQGHIEDLIALGDLLMDVCIVPNYLVILISVTCIHNIGSFIFYIFK